MKITKSLLIVALFLIPILISAEDEITLAALSSIPLRAGSIQELVPESFYIENKIYSDLNGDSKDDIVIQLRHSGENSEGERILLVVISNPADGSYIKKGATDSVLQCATCGGALYGAVDAPVNIEIKNRVINITQESGSREVNQEIFRFRFEKNRNDFMLIGYDNHYYDRATGDEYVESTNLITGKSVVTKKKYDSIKEASKVILHKVERKKRHPFSINTMNTFTRELLRNP